MRARPVPLEERFWKHVDKTGPCWVWTGAIKAEGYGAVGIPGRRVGYAHRVSYELVKGPIPEGHQIDHLCGNRACVKPAHLEAVTQQENIRRATHWNLRKTHCPAGHAYAGDNLLVTSRRDGRRMRICRACQRARRS